MTETPTAVRTSPITWFEIPTADFDRARRFYETILETTLSEQPFGSARVAVFPHADERAPGGCLDEGSESRPCPGGTVIYLDVTGRLDRTLDLVERAGGRVAADKMELSGIGWVAQIFDSEGNRIGLHAIS